MKPIFIGGTGRSGTTILKRVLTCHSKIVSLRDELRVITDPGGALDLISALSGRWSPYNADAAMHRFRDIMLECARTSSKAGIFLEKAERKIFRSLGVSPRRYLGSGFTYYFDASFYHQRLDRLIQELCYHITKGSWIGSPPFRVPSKIFECGPMPRADVERILERFFQDLYTNLAREGQTHWLDDTPTNLLHTHELRGLFPDMRLVHIYRDPRDVTASYSRFAWGGGNFVAIARRLAGIYRHWFEIREGLSGDCVLEISLEELAAEPVAGLTKICNFVELDFEESLMQIPLDKVHAGRWRRDIPESEWEAVESHLGQFIKTYGYTSAV